MPSDNETENKKEGLGRRTFLKSAGVLGAGLLTSGLPVAAGPFSPGEPTHGGVPENKKLNQQWTGSLTERGIPTTYLKSKNELRFIGMPVGGIMTGTLYLGGDGRLWLWDIFNSKRSLPGAAAFFSKTWNRARVCYKGKMQWQRIYSSAPRSRLGRSKLYGPISAGRHSVHRS
jgi:hypothetical protein